jgi:hypothetical protein
MPTTIRNLIRALSMAAVLTAAMGMPAGDVGAAGKDCKMPRNVPVVGGDSYPDGGKHRDEDNGKTYICDNGSWIIITDERLDPGTQPPLPRFPGVFVAPASGGILAQP